MSIYASHMTAARGRTIGTGIAVLLSSACGASLAEQSAKWVDCAPDEIQIELEERSGQHRSWEASCKGSRYECESTPNDSRCTQTSTPAASPRPAPIAAKTPEGPSSSGARAWRIFDAKDCGMKIMLPGTPTENRSTVKVGQATLNVYEASVELKDPNASVDVSCMELPPTVSADAIVDGARNGMIREMKGTLVREDPAPAPLKGRDLRIALAGEEVRVRLLIAQGRLVSLTLAPSSGFSLAEADPFFNPTFTKP